MQINLNNSSELTVENVRNLLAYGNDAVHTQVRVTKSGVAYLSQVVGNKDTDNLAFRLETFAAGNGLVGPKAVNDEEWILRIYNCLKKNWPIPESSYIDSF